MNDYNEMKVYIIFVNNYFLNYKTSMCNDIKFKKYVEWGAYVINFKPPDPHFSISPFPFFCPPLMRPVLLAAIRPTF